MSLPVRPQQVLVVEDDPGTAVLQRRRLERSGYAVVTTKTAEDALERLREDSFDAVVLDQRLPGGSGLWLCAQLRAIGCETPVVMVSGLAEQDVVLAALRVGVCDFVEKGEAYLDDLPGAVAGAVARRAAEGGGVRGPADAGEVVLLVQGEVAASGVRRGALESAGYRVATASDAAQALEVMHDGRVRLVVLEGCAGAERTGLAVYRTLRAAGHDVPAVLLTGADDDRSAIEALRLGVREVVLARGGVAHELLPAVERVLERSRLERGLAESRAHLAGVVDAAMDAILTVDDALRVTLFNPAAEEVFGISASRAMHEPLARFLPEVAAELAAARARASAVRMRCETLVRRDDGTSVPLDVTVGEGRVGSRRFWTVGARDVAEQRRSREALQLADRRKDEFVAMLAHELRNPLGPIRHAVEILGRISQDERVLDVRAMVGRQVAHMSRLIDDLLDVARITRGTFDLRRERLPLARVVDEAVQSVRPLLETRGHRLVQPPVDPALCVDGDPARLVQVIGNLLGNAAKFTPEPGTIRLVVGREGEQAVVRVRDQGIGVAPDATDRIFELFVQEHATFDRAHGGLGIGLTLVKTIVEMHGGRVEVSSEGPGHGAEFRVALPACDPAAGASRPGPAGGPDAPPRGRRRVLVVEDHEDAAESFRMLLELDGQHVRVARDGVEALRLVAEEPVDVAFVDLGLPGFDGFEVARRLRRAGSGAMTLVALSGYGRREDKTRAAAAGFDAHFTKPIDFAAVRQLLASG